MKIFLCVLFLTISGCAFANAGSPFVWFNIFHLLIANAFIGLTESVILGKYKIAHKTGIIIFSNYVSMAIGFIIIFPLIATTKYGRDIESSDNYFFALLAAFTATLIIEYPFFVNSLKNKKDRQRLLIPFFVANLATNAVMFLIYIFLQG